MLVLLVGGAGLGLAGYAALIGFRRLLESHPISIPGGSQLGVATAAIAGVAVVAAAAAALRARSVYRWRLTRLEAAQDEWASITTPPEISTLKMKAQIGPGRRPHTVQRLRDYRPAEDAASQTLRDVVRVGMVARTLTEEEPTLDAEQRAWMHDLASTHEFRLVRLVVAFLAAEDATVIRARVACTLVAAGQGSARPVVWSLTPKEVVAAESKRASKVTVGANLQLVEASRETSVEDAARVVRVRGSGELQAQALWELTGSQAAPLAGDHQFIVVARVPAGVPCRAHAWVAMQTVSRLGLVSGRADLAPDQEWVNL